MGDGRLADQLDARKHRAVADSGGAENGAVAMNKVIRVVNPLQIGDGVSLQENPPLLLVTRPHPQEDIAAESLERRCREDPLGGAATPDKKVDS